MIDPKQGPLLHTRRNAELSGPSRPHSVKRASADAVSEAKHPGGRPFTTKRQFSVIEC
jgi:hypothetical protein